MAAARRVSQDLLSLELDRARLEGLRAVLVSGAAPVLLDVPANATREEIDAANAQMQAQALEQAGKIADIDQQIAEKHSEAQQAVASIAKVETDTGPVMGRATRLNANKATRQFLKKWHHLRSPQRFAHHDVPVSINSVNLKNVFGQIKADRGNLHAGGSFARVCLIATPFWHLDAVSGSHPPHLLSD